MKPMQRRVFAAGLLVGGLAFAACGSAGPGVQARQSGDTTTTTTAPGSTTTATGAPETTAPGTTAPPAAATVTQAPCTKEALEAAYNAAYGGLNGAVLKPQKCVGGWATSSELKGLDPPAFALYRAEGDHWVALNRSAGRLCAGHGVPPEVAPQIGCDT